MKLHWGNAIFIFFAIFITLAIVFMVFAFRQKIDLVEDDYYNKGASFSKQIEINQRSEIYSDSIKINLIDGTVELYVCEEIKQTVEFINVYFFNPSDKKMDAKFVLDTKKVPLQINKDEILPGRYIVKFSWEVGNEVFNVEEELFVR